MTTNGGIVAELLNLPATSLAKDYKVLLTLDQPQIDVPIHRRL